MEEIMSPMFDGLNHCIELNIINVVVRLSAGKFLTKVGYRSALLT